MAKHSFEVRTVEVLRSASVENEYFNPREYSSEMAESRVS